MRQFSEPLPIDAALGELTAALRASNAAVLVAPPGAGKTTRVPLVLLDQPWAKENNKYKKILVLEPRRLAGGGAGARRAAAPWACACASAPKCRNARASR
jgi:ATP-dependent helicase HrpB